MPACRLRFFPGGYSASAEGLRRFGNFAGTSGDMEDGVGNVSWIGGKEGKEERINRENGEGPIDPLTLKNRIGYDWVSHLGEWDRW